MNKYLTDRMELVQNPMDAEQLLRDTGVPDQIRDKVKEMEELNSGTWPGGVAVELYGYGSHSIAVFIMGRGMMMAMTCPNNNPRISADMFGKEISLLVSAMNESITGNLLDNKSGSSLEAMTRIVTDRKSHFITNGVMIRQILLATDKLDDVNEAARRMRETKSTQSMGVMGHKTVNHRIVIHIEPEGPTAVTMFPIDSFSEDAVNDFIRKSIEFSMEEGSEVELDVFRKSNASNN